MTAKKRRTELDVDTSMSEAPDEKEPQATEPKPPKEEQAPAQPKRKINKAKLLLVAGLGLVAVLITSAIGWGVVSYLGSAPEEPVAKQKVEKVKPVAALVPTETVIIPPMFEFKPFHVTLEEKGHNSLVKISMAAEMSAPEVKKEIVRNLVLVRENVYFFLQQKSNADFGTEKKRRRMAIDIAILLNGSIQAGAVTKILITDLNIQKL